MKKIGLILAASLFMFACGNEAEGNGDCAEKCKKENCEHGSEKCKKECKKKCANKTEAEKMACAKDCKKACCAKAEKA